VGAVRRIRNPIGQVSLSALEDKWQRDATAAAIAAARNVIRTDGPIPPGTPVGRLSDTEWGWIVASVLFAWIGKRAEQAVSEQIDTERLIRMTALDPQPWDAGAVAAVLPDLADACSGLDWSKPLTTWPKDDIIEFLLKAMPLFSQGDDRARPERQGDQPQVERRYDRAPSERRRRWSADDAGRAGRRDWNLNQTAVRSVSCSI
jgi:hypothetical protein